MNFLAGRPAFFEVIWLFRKFVETAGTVEIERGRRIVVTFDRRCHHPILREAALSRDDWPSPG